MRRVLTTLFLLMAAPVWAAPISYETNTNRSKLNFQYDLLGQASRGSFKSSEY